MSSIKPEVHNILLRRQTRTEPRTKNDEDRMCTSEDIIADRQTHTHTHACTHARTHTHRHACHNTPFPYRGGVKASYKTNPQQIKVTESKVDERVVNSSHDASTVVGVDNKLHLLWQNFVTPKFGTKFQAKVPLFLEIPEFLYNTVCMRGRKPRCQNPARFDRLFRCSNVV